MDDTANTTAPVPTVVAAPSETFLQELEAKVEALGEDVKADIEMLMEEFDKDVLPYIKAFITTLAGQDAQAALKAVIASVPLLASGNVAGAAAAVGAAVVATTAMDAGADAQTILAQAQAALGQTVIVNTAGQQA